MSANDVGEAHQQRLANITDRASAASLRAWSRMDLADLDGSWDAIAPTLVLQGASAQFAAVSLADRYTSSLSREYGFDPDLNTVDADAFIGVDGSGRSMGGLLRGAVTTTKEAIGAGLGPRALEVGASYLAAMMSTLVADISRNANQVSGVAKGYTTYARVVEPGACSRCVVLAGATQFGPFQRHPKCKCTLQPVPGGFDQVKDAGSVFDSMSSVEQDRVFGRAGAEAIRSGAEISSVVTARRGAMKGISSAQRSLRLRNGLQRTTVGYRADGSAIRAYTTSEGATPRGRYGRNALNAGSDAIRLKGARYTSTKRIRLMPESILEVTPDLAERQALLIDAGYMNPAGKAGAEINAARLAARVQADAIYRRAGIRIQ